MRSPAFAAAATAAAALLLIIASPGDAQHRFDIGVFGGYTLSEGLDFNPVQLDGETYRSLDPESGFSFGVDFGVFANRVFQIGFLFDQQQSTFVVDGTARREFVGVDINNYHCFLAYHPSQFPEHIRPFLLFGVGATHYLTGEFDGGEIDNEIKFSSTAGAGVKFYRTENLGFKFMSRWTPTYIKSDPSGNYCNSTWGCFETGDAGYSNQFQMSAGVIYHR
jgi:hypothetical protein